MAQVTFKDTPTLIQSPPSINNISETDFDEAVDENIILERLNELRQWQEEQRMILVENQLDQQKMLQLEKQKLYEMFGLQVTPNDTARDNSDNSFDIHDNVNNENQIDRSTPKCHSNTNNEKKLQRQSPSIKQIRNIIGNLENRKIDQERNVIDAHVANIPKKPFLKRGEGLKSRFKVSPDAYRLNNLPKYKFANKNRKHAQHTDNTNKKRHQHAKTNDAKTLLKVDRTNEPISGASQNDWTSELSKSCEKINELRLIKSSSKLSSQQSKQNKCNKLTTSSHHVNRYSCENQSEDAFENSAISDQLNLPRFRPHLSTPLGKYLLDTPTRNQVQLQQDELNELKYFEHLERNLGQNSTMEGDTSEKNVMLQFKVGLSLSPSSYAQRENDDVNEKQEKQSKHNSSGNFGDESKHVRFTSSAVRIENEGQHPMEDIYAIPQVSSPNEKSMESFQRFKEKLFDRKLKRKFQNQLSLAKDFEISDLNSNSSNYDEDDESRAARLSVSSDGADQSDSDKNDVVRERLLSLKREIQSFREQNTELTNSIREHELIRMAFDQERREANERMENERINFNIYMHDERLKLLNERTDWEKSIKDSQKLNRSEKDELIRLREKCSKHATELSAQEQKHVAAQARVRAQLKCMEKEFKELRMEVENLRRENKKLETENIRLRRESNNKILHEINKSISKLAKAKSDDNQCESEKEVRTTNARSGVKKCSNKNAHKTVVAKVTSHREPMEGNRLRSKSVPDLQQDIDEYICETISDGENSDSSPAELDPKSSYFPNKSEENYYSNVKHESRAQSGAKKDVEKSTKRIIENSDGSKDIWYSNGNLKKITADGMCIRMLYFNKDIKETDIKEGTVKYYYAETNTWQTTYLDGLEIFEYPNGQTEHRFKNGTIEIHFPNGSVRITNPEREHSEGIKEEWKYADGTNVIQLKNGERILMMPNGQREVHANGHKRREYPDGTVKIVYPDGSQETRYSNGRVRLKNKEGKLIMDSETISI